MKITNSVPGSIVLSRLKNQTPQAVFQFNGHTYLAIDKTSSDKANVAKDPGFIACINLKTHAIRGIPYDAEVVEVNAELRINAK